MLLFSVQTTLEAVQEDVIAATSNKVPGVRAETCLYIGRAFANMTVTTLNKKLLKTFIGPLIKCSADTTMEVREASFSALGTAMFVVTEKNITPFLADVDNIRLSRIKEFYEKVVEERRKGKSYPFSVTGFIPIGAVIFGFESAAFPP